RPAELRQRYLHDVGAARDEMQRRVDVRTDVHAGGDAAQVGRARPGDVTDAFVFERRVRGPGDDAIGERARDVNPFALPFAFHRSPGNRPPRAHHARLRTRLICSIDEISGPAAP